MSGTLYGVGVGPGDPDLMTLKAVRILQQAPVLAYPAPLNGDSLARSIAFEAKASGDLKDILEVRDREVSYKRKLEKNETVLTPITGFGDAAADYNITVENRKTGAGVRVTGDQPLSRVVFWSASKVVSPEAYVSLKIAPGQERQWRMTYEFYTLPTNAKQ